MKKSLLALAVLGAFAGAASAQSSVTIYGIVDTSVSRIDNGNNSVVGIDSGNNAASRIGFKGVEDLGNGLQAEFVLENGINTDDGTGGAGFSRLAFVGLNGAFGKVRLGKQEIQTKEMLNQIDPFSASGMVNAVDFINGGGLDQRIGNQIVWMSNNYSGFSASVGYIFGETNGDNSANRGYGLRLGYANGPLNVQFAYEKQNSTDTLSDNTVDPAGVDADDKNMLLGATYDFGSFKLHGIYGQRKISGDVGGVASPDVKIRSGLIGATVPFGASAIRAEYIRNNVRDIAGVDADADSSLWALSYTYAMSKRTTLYATYARTTNDDNYDLGIGGPGGAVAGENGSGIAVGIQHKF
jgi:predicted porin